MLIKSLVLIVTIAMLGFSIYYPKSTNATSMYSDFTAKKLDRLAQEYAQHREQARQYQTTHPNNKSVFSIPMGADPRQKIERVPEQYWQIGWLFNGPYNVSELWIVGEKPYFEQNAWNPAYAYSGSLKDNPQQGFIGTFVMNGASDHRWSGIWKTPQPWGSVKITNVTTDLASFVTDLGVNGTFNLDTHEWKTISQTPSNITRIINFLSTKIQSINISDDLPAGTYWSPNDQKSVLSEVLSWIKTAIPYTVKVPESEDVGVFFAKIGPSILNISALSQHEIIYPAWYTKRDGQKNDAYSVVHYVQSVVAFDNGKEITYLELEPLYNWLKKDEWKTEFKRP